MPGRGYDGAVSSPGSLETPAGPAADHGLLRVVPRWQVVAIAVNGVIGSGVYLLPAAAAALTGTASLPAVALAGVAVLLIVLCFAEASSHFDEPGGAYVYTREAFGSLVGFEVGWMTWLARIATLASLSVGFAAALGYLWPAAAEGTGQQVVITLQLLLLTWLNWIGVKSGAVTSVVLAIGKVVPLLIFLLVGLFAFKPEIFAGQAAVVAGRAEWTQAALLLLFAYAGFENTPAPAGEYQNPRRDVPYALIAQTVFVIIIYTAVQAVALGTLPGLAGSKTPLADAARLFMGPLGGLLLTAGAVISILGTNSNTVLAGPRYLYAMAKNGYGPAWLSHLHPRYATPTGGLVLQLAVGLPLALTGSFTGLAALSAVARLATYLGTAAAVPILRRTMPAPPAFRLWGGPLIPLAAVALTAGLALSTTVENLLAAGAALLVGWLLHLFRRR